MIVVGMSTNASENEDDAAIQNTSFTIEPKKDMKIVVGGWLTIIAGVLVIRNGLGGFVALHDSLGWPAFLCTVPVTLMGVIAVVGGICALRNIHFSLALAGAFLAAFGDGFTTFAMGVVALLLFIMTGRDL